MTFVCFVVVVACCLTPLAFFLLEAGTDTLGPLAQGIMPENALTRRIYPVPSREDCCVVSSLTMRRPTEYLAWSIDALVPPLRHSQTEQGEMERSEGGSITEGIGQGRVTGNLATCEGLIDGAFFVRRGVKGTVDLWG